MKAIQYILLALLVIISGCVSQDTSRFQYEKISVQWLGHASFRIDGSKVVYFDPYVLDDNPGKADYILITHDHPDHCAVDNIKKIQSNDTRIIGTLECIKKLDGKTNSIDAGESFSYADGVSVEAFHAYNREKEYHPKGFGTGLLLTIDGVSIYHAGDTDLIPEMEQLRGRVDVLLIPIGGKYTMGEEEAALAAEAIQPKTVIPMHYSSDKYGIEGIGAEPAKLEEALKGKGIKVVVLKASV